MGCIICSRSSCAAWMHPEEEQDRYEKAIEAYERYREIRDAIRDSENEEEPTDAV